ncbi:MAG TPA: hypothetical protein VF702_02245 [Allosphingosinicella sp.]|jgi:hypothetical protein
MGRQAWALFAGVAALAGCGESEPALNDQQLAESIEKVADVAPAPKSEPPGPALIPIRPEDLQAAIRPGGGCEFSEDGRLLFVARSTGETLARINGTVVRLARIGPTEPSGGFFANAHYSISIGRLTDAGVTVEKATTWPARLTLTDRLRREVEALRLEGAWRCSG